MAPIFPVYWHWLGLPLSRAKGAVIDRLPFSLVETTIWIGVAFAAVLVAAAISGKWRALRGMPALFALLCAGPAILICMAMGQGAFPMSLSPTAWRTPLARAFPAPPLPYPDFRRELGAREERLMRTFNADYYYSLGEAEILAGCDRLLDAELAALGLPAGRTVGRMKPMGPLTTLVGLSYGGPAFHDPFFGELAMVPPDDHPAPRYWRLIGACHEAAHAKGFTREMDAEILTQLALERSPDPRYRMLGDIMYLRKSGERVHFPEGLRRDMRMMWDSLARVERRQPAVRFLRTLNKKLGFQNSGGKYGSRTGAEAWDPAHPFYATVAGLMRDRATPEGRTPE